ncbi:hypothetical protein AVEN_245748-1, partial [Araneus ventricosus]
VPCTDESQCGERQKCVGEEGKKTCQCANGLGGENCELEEWCEKTGKFENCKGENGTCEYSKEKRSVVCTCATGKKLHPEENICKGVGQKFRPHKGIILTNGLSFIQKIFVLLQSYNGVWPLRRIAVLLLLQFSSILLSF